MVMTAAGRFFGAVSGGMLLVAMLGGTVSAQSSAQTAVAAEEPVVASQTFWVFLDRGESPEELSNDARMKMQQEHIANLMRLYQEGKSPLAGPLGQESKKTRGIVIVTGESAESVRKEFAGDPYIKHGHLTVRVYPWSMTTGSIRRVEAMTGLGEYVLGIVTRDDETEPDVATAAFRRLEKELGAKTAAGGIHPLAVAGAIDAPADDGLVGIFLFRIADLKETRLLIDAAHTPSGSEALDVKLIRQYLGKGLIDEVPPTDASGAKGR